MCCGMISAAEVKHDFYVVYPWLNDNVKSKYVSEEKQKLFELQDSTFKAVLAMYTQADPYPNARY